MSAQESAGAAGARRKAVLVLGMHRSGTSALTRILNLLGVDLGSKLMPASPENEAGYWEHAEIVRIHDELLGELGTSWDGNHLLSPELLTSEDAEPFKRRHGELLALVAILNALSRLGMELVRRDSEAVALGFKGGQLGALIVLAAGVALFVWARRTRREAWKGG